MKNEYLSRTVTLNRKSLERAVNDTGVDLAMGRDGDLIEVTLAALATKITRSKLCRAMFGDSDEPVTILGSDFASKELEALREVYEDGATTAKKMEANCAPVFDLCGRAVELLLHLEDKLFGSDHVEEHESVKNEKEDTDA